jgi:hypothetical protein
MTSIDGARKIAKRLMDLYDVKKIGHLSNSDV